VTRRPNATQARWRVASWALDGAITATREDGSNPGRRPVFQVRRIGIPDANTVATITRLMNLGLLELVFREQVGRFAHYRVDPTSAGREVFAARGFHAAKKID